MAGSDNMSAMMGASRAKSAGKRQANPTPTPQGATLNPASKNVLSDVPTSAGPQPMGDPVGNGMGHMGGWADKMHPVSKT